MNRYEKEMKAIEQAMLNHVHGFEGIYERERKEDRKLTDEELIEVGEHTKAIEVLKEQKQQVEANLKTLQEVHDLGVKLGPVTGGTTDVRVSSEPADRVAQYAQKTLGRMFVESESYKAAQQTFKEKGGLPENWSTGRLTFETKAGTVLEGAGAPGSGQGGGLIPVPQVIPGVVEKLFQPLRVADLLLQGQTTTSSLRYVVEGTATSGAAAVAEGGNKPASDLALSTVDEPVKKIATVLTVSDEMLEDAAQVESYINGRLSLFVSIQEETSIVAGAGTNDLVGLTAGARGINVYARGTVDDNATALFKALNGQRGSAFLEPDFIVMNPANWQTTRLAKDSAGQFFGGGPFMGQYGSGQNLQQSGQITGVQDAIWNKPVVVTTAIGAGTALIGSRPAAQIWRRGGVTVEATNSHASYFTSNLVAIRAESRLALAVYRAAGFTAVTGLA